MNFLEAVETCFRKYASGRGRASRSEFWYWTLFNVLVGLVAITADYLLFPTTAWNPIETLTDIALFLPSWAVAIRRLHDINRTGYWLLIALTGIGIVLLIYWDCVKGTNGDNDYGSDPLKSLAA
ncbi:MAG TPA: DUF805 domain-containing protein [Pseudolabrys sp.]|nr:DUF805 domain-containing protein [Pseudolabrys sp.]